MNFWQKTKRFLEPCVAFPGATIGRIVMTSNTTCFTLYLAYLLKEIVTIIEKGDQDNFVSLILWGAGIMLGFQITGFIGRNYFWVEQQFRWDSYIIRKYLKKFITLDPLVVESMGTGKIYNIFDKGTSESVLLLLSFIAQAARVVLTTFFGFFLVQGVPWYIITTGFTLIVIMYALIIYLNKFTTHFRRQRKENNIKIGGAFAKIIMSKFEILQNNQIDQEIEKIRKINDISWGLARKQNFWGSFLFQGPKFLLSVIIVGAYYYLGNRVFGGTYELGNMVGLLTVLALFEFTLRDGIEYYENFTKTFIHVEKLWDFMDNTPTIEGYDTGKNFVFNKGNFDIKNLSFSYNDSTEVLSHFSLSIQGGKRTALVGRSGSGKTTLMKLLAGYMPPTGGQLLIDGQDITIIRLDSYYPHIGYLTQEPSVFDGTIEENLLFGMKSEETEKGTETQRKKDLHKKIKHAIELSECQFIYELEKGLKTEIGERGVRLSGGQKQRLAIAKIFLKNPEIILLDEPTAALDSYSEEKVARAFEHLFEGRTVIVIAHRLQTVKSADDIIVMEKGTVVERGTHKQLLKLGGKYAGMVDLQSGIVKENSDSEVLNFSKGGFVKEEAE